MGASKRLVRTVLLIDDYESQLNGWARDFQREGKAVLKAVDRNAAIEMARAHRPDVAVVDLFLANENGLLALRDLKAIDPNMFVVIVSADLSVAYAMAAMRAGADDVFVKPIRCKQLVARVEEGLPLEPDWTNGATKLTLDAFTWEHISRAMLECGNNVTHAADRLGCHRTTLQRKLQRRGHHG